MFFKVDVESRESRVEIAPNAIVTRHSWPKHLMIVNCDMTDYKLLYRSGVAGGDFVFSVEC